MQGASKNLAHNGCALKTFMPEARFFFTAIPAVPPYLSEFLHLYLIL